MNPKMNQREYWADLVSLRSPASGRKKGYEPTCIRRRDVAGRVEENRHIDIPHPGVWKSSIDQVD